MDHLLNANGLLDSFDDAEEFLRRCRSEPDLETVDDDVAPVELWLC